MPSSLRLLQVTTVMLMVAYRTLARSSLCFLRPALLPRSTISHPHPTSSWARGGGSRGLMAMASPPDGHQPLRSSPPPAASISLGGGKIADWSGDLLVLPVYQPEEGEGVATITGGDLAEWDGKLEGALADLIQTKDFKGKAGSSIKVRLSKSSPVKGALLVGVGKKSAFKEQGLGGLGSALAAEVKAEKPKTVAVGLPEAAGDVGAQLMAEELMAGLYLDTRFKSGKDVDKLPDLQAVHLFGGKITNLDKSVSDAKAIAEGIRLTKDLVNAPPNYVKPSTLANTAKEISKDFGWNLEILNEAQCRDLKMYSYLAVAKGSVEPPEFIHLTYKPEGAVTKKLVLIGKGLTFDSGGYNLKVAGSMIELMKFDMGGAGAVLGAARALAEIKPPGVEIHVIVAACENMISSKAYRPGDILTASNGKTIEVINTDAEGRLTLCDALVYAEKLKPDVIVDAATLTGACIIALGGEYAGMWSNNEDLAKALEESAKAKGEKLWRMPLAEEYKANIKSEIADLKNVGGREGGSITAALFLQNFVDAKTPWAHLDIAGPVWNSKKGGATGYGVRTLTQWVLSQAK